MNIDRLNIIKSYRCTSLFTRVAPGLILAVMGCGMSIAQNVTTEDCVAEYVEKRVDITPSINNFDFAKLSGCNHSVLDLTGIDDGKTINFTHRIYCDTLRECYGSDEVEWDICISDTILRKGIFSRQRSISFQKGLVIGMPWESPAGNSSYFDEMTVVDADGKKSKNVVTVTHVSTDGHTVILSDNDTIDNVRLIVTEVTCSAVQSSSGDKLRGLLCMRWWSRDNRHAIVEYAGYQGWNADKEFATAIMPDKTERPKLKDNERSNFLLPELRYLTVSDLSGKVLRSYSPDEMDRIHDYGLRPGWYIITEYYTDRNISRKEYIWDVTD